MTEPIPDPYEGLERADHILAPTAIMAVGVGVNGVALISSDRVQPALILEFHGTTFDEDVAPGRVIGCQAVVPARGIDRMLRLMLTHRNAIASQNPGPDFEAPSVTRTALEYIEKTIDNNDVEGQNHEWRNDEVVEMLREIVAILVAEPEGNLG